MKKTIIISIIIVIAVGALVSYALYKPGDDGKWELTGKKISGVSVDMETGKVVNQKNDGRAFASIQTGTDVVAVADQARILSSGSPTSGSGVVSKSPSTGQTAITMPLATPKPGTNNTSTTQKPVTNNTSTTQKPVTNNTTTIGDEKVPASNNWLETRIEKHRSEIDSSDLADFRRIVGMLDQGYIQGLANDGFDSKEQGQLQTYLGTALNSGDYERAKELFGQYANLMEEE